MFQVMVSGTFQKQFTKVSKDVQKRIRKGLKEIEKDPFNSRSGADIKALKDTDPQKHRLRVGEYRLIYHVDGTRIMVIELFIRSRGYRE